MWTVKWSISQQLVGRILSVADEFFKTKTNLVQFSFLSFFVGGVQIANVQFVEQEIMWFLQNTGVFTVFLMETRIALSSKIEQGHQITDIKVSAQPGNNRDKKTTYNVLCTTNKTQRLPEITRTILEQLLQSSSLV